MKELIYRSLERQNLDKVYRQIQELRKRLRTREQKAVRASSRAVPRPDRFLRTHLFDTSYALYLRSVVLLHAPPLPLSLALSEEEKTNDQPIQRNQMTVVCR